jgi:hypothetical protein
MLNLTDIASLEKARKQREAARRMQESQRGESVMWRRQEAEWLPDYQRPGGHALEAPMFSPDDLIGSGISKPIMLGAKALAGLSGAGLAAMAKGAGSKSLADVVRGARQETGGFKAPTQFELAHRQAQKNAVEMLGLPANNTAMDRAVAMGFEGGWAHGSPVPDISELRSSKIGAEGRGAYATDYLPESGTYASNKSGATVYPLMVSRAKTLNSDAGSAAYSALNANTDDELALGLKAINLDSITAKQPATEQWLVDAGAPYMPERRHFVSDNPANFRSKFAAFDPARRHEADILGFGNPQLLGGIAAGGSAAGYVGKDYFADSINEMERKRLEDEARRRALMEAQ